MIYPSDLPKLPPNPTDADMDFHDEMVVMAWRHNIGWWRRLVFDMGFGSDREPRGIRYFGMKSSETKAKERLA